MVITALFVAALIASPGIRADEYPPIVKEKKLYAAKDFRGLKAPEFVVEKWLTEKPNVKDKIVIIDFWATWCGPCRGLIPKLNNWQEKFKDDVVIIGISDEPAEKVEKFKETTKMAYSEAIDPQKRMSKEIGVQGIPHVLIITPDGIVRWQGFPGSKEDPLDEDKIGQIVKAWKASKG